MNKPFSLWEICRRVLTVLLTICMVSMNSPIAYAAEAEGAATKPQAAEVKDNEQDKNTATATEGAEATNAEASSSETAPKEVAVTKPEDNATSGDEALKQDVEVVDNSSVNDEDTIDLDLALDNAYIHFKNQVVSAPVDSISVPAGQPFTFSAAADEGCEITDVKVVVDGRDIVLEQDESGKYVIPTDDLKPGVKLIVKAMGNTSSTPEGSIPIEEKRNTKDTFTAEDEDVKVTATLTDPSALPEDIEFKIARVTKDSQKYDYDAYIEALNQQSIKETPEGEQPFVYNDDNTVMYDIAFMQGDKEIILDKGIVKIKFEYKKNLLADEDKADGKSEIEYHHLPIADDVREGVKSTADATNLKAEDIVVEDVMAVKIKDDGSEAEFAQKGLSIDTVTLRNQANGNQQNNNQATSVTAGPTNDYNYATILGPALNYGVVANIFIQSAHAQTNFAANYYAGNGEGIQPDLAGSSGAIIMGSLTAKGMKLNTNSNNDGLVQVYYGDCVEYSGTESNPVFTTRPDPTSNWPVYESPAELHRFTHDYIANTFVNPMIDYVKDMSVELASHQDTMPMPKIEDQNNYVIDTTRFDDNVTIYLDGDFIAHAMQEYRIQNGGLKINKLPGQTIIFNIRDEYTDTIKMQRYDIDNNGGKNYKPTSGDQNAGGPNGRLDETARHIIWNVVNKANMRLADTAGMFLIPADGSYVDLEGVPTGWLVCGGTFKNSGNEWHNSYSGLPTVAKANLQAYKTVDNKIANGSQTFTFAVEKYNPQTKAFDEIRTENNTGGIVQFNGIDGLDLGWNVFKIVEKSKAASTAGSYTIDTTEHFAAVKYTNNNSQAYASAAVYYKAFNSGAFDVNADSETTFMSQPENRATFNNTTGGQPTELRATVTPKATKAMETGSPWPAGTDFTFKLTPKNGAPMPNNANELTATATSSAREASFDTITYTGTSPFTAVDYEYEITEVSDSNKTNIVDYDTAKYTLKVHVYEDNGQLHADPTYYKDGQPVDGVTSATFTNIYKSTCELPLQGKKTIENRSFKDGDSYTFNVNTSNGAPKPKDENGNEVSSITITPNSGNEAALDFGSVTFTKADYDKEYTYTISEANGGTKENGVTYDATTYEVKVKIEMDDNGNLVATKLNTVDNTNLNFTNTYSATGKIKFDGSKKVRGLLTGERELKQGEVYRFNIVEKLGTATTRTWGTDKVYTNSDGTINFPEITYDLDNAGKTYEYEVTEVAPVNTTVSRDEHTYKVKVRVTDNGDGTLKPEIIETSGKKEFVNTEYEAEGVLPLSGKKTLIGRSMVKNEFKFEVKDANGNVVSRGTNDGVPVDTVVNGKLVSTSPIVFNNSLKYTLADKDKDFTYTVAETSTIAGVTKKVGQHTFVVHVSDGGNGEMVANVTKFDGKQFNSGNVSFSLDFTNEYNASGDTDLTINKRMNKGELAAGDFSFSIYKADKQGNKYVATGNALATVKNGEGRDADGNPVSVEKAYFNKSIFSFTQDDLYSSDGEEVGTPEHTSKNFYYIVKENIPAGAKDVEGNSNLKVLGNIIYDASEKLVVVNVTNYENGAYLGNLKVSVDNNSSDPTATPEDKFTFVNEEQNSTTYAPSATKSVVVRSGSETRALNNVGDYGPFYFKLTDITDANKPKVLGDQVEAVNGEVTFDEITYNAEDVGKTFKYQIEEIEGDNDYIKYDPQPETIEVTVTKDNDNKVVYTVRRTTKGTDANSQPEFVNEYAAKGDAVFTAQKTLHNGAIKANQFDFELTGDKINGSQTKKNDATGKVTFDAIPFTMDDLWDAEAGAYKETAEFNYTIKELIPTDAKDKDGQKFKDGVYYDQNNVKNMKVVVTNNHNGTLSVTYNNSTELNASFSNTYTANGTAQITAKKTVNGVDPNAKTGANGAFIFELYAGNLSAEQIETATPIETVNNNGSNVTFPALSYTLKDLDKDENGNYKKTEKVYTVREAAGGNSNYKYDPKLVPVTVTLEDQGNGVIKTDVKPNGTDPNGTDITFDNTYKATGQVELTATKVLNDSEGRSYNIKRGNYEFTLTKPDGTTETQKNGIFKTADGIEENLDSANAIKFNAIQYNREDAGKDFTYTIKENIPEGADEKRLEDGSVVYVKDNLTYDGHEETVKVHVEDPGTGGSNSLRITYKYEDNGEEVSVDQYRGATFTNTYNASGNYAVSARKTISGKHFKAGDTMTFTLSGYEVTKNAEGKWVKNEAADAKVAPMPADNTKTVDILEGHTDDFIDFSFDKMNFTMADAGKTYLYTVTETAKSDASVTLDTADHTVRLTVKDDGKGHLSATDVESSTDGGLKLTNSYASAAKLTFAGNKTLTGRKMAQGETYDFKIVEVEGETEKAVVTTGQSVVTDEQDENAVAINFAKPVEFNQNDNGVTKHYRVYETSADANGVTIDKTVYNFDIKVNDDGNKNITFDIDGADKSKLNIEAAGKDENGVPVFKLSGLDFENTYDANAKIRFVGNKKMTGRKMTAGEKYSFQITEGNEVVRSGESTANNGDEQAAINFGEAIEYTLDQAGTTHNYKISEVQPEEGADTKGVTYDKAEYNFSVKITDNNSGALTLELQGDDASKLNLTYNETDKVWELSGANFTNTYEATGHVDIETEKILGRKWKNTDSFSFTLKPANDRARAVFGNDDMQATTKDKLAEDGKTLRHIAEFDHTKSTYSELNFNLRDVADEPCILLLTEDLPAENDRIPGVTYDQTIYQVSVSITGDDGNGNLNVSKSINKIAGVNEDGSNKLEPVAEGNLPEFNNKYEAGPISVVYKARKKLNTTPNNAGINLERGKFNFVLYDEVGQKIAEQRNGYGYAADGKTVVELDDVAAVEFAPIKYDGTHNYTYYIQEEIPSDADKIAGMTYDDTRHEIHVAVTDKDGDGYLEESHYYDDQKNSVYNVTVNGTTASENAYVPEFVNTLFRAKANIEFNKYFYGNGTREFTFTMVEADQDFNIQTGTTTAKTLTAKDFANGYARVKSEDILYSAPGKHYYVIRENPTDNNVTRDLAEILATVNVKEDGSTDDVTYKLRYPGQEPMDINPQDATLYNNGLVRMSFRSSALRAMAESARFTNYEPAVRKVLKNGVLKGEDFKFAIYAGESAEGEPMDIVSNDINGRVSFDPIPYGASDIGKTYKYTIVEQSSDDKTIEYDKNPIKLTVKVSEGTDGEVIAEGTYESANDNGQYTVTDDPTFINTYSTVMIHTIKRSREVNNEGVYDGLPGAHYGLWMVNPNGEDVYLGLGRDKQEEAGSKLESGPNGDLYYNIPDQPGAAFYFLEEFPPPAGHLVDPYPTDLFTIVHEDGSYRVVYEDQPEFAQLCPGVSYKDADGGRRE